MPAGGNLCRGWYHRAVVQPGRDVEQPVERERGMVRVRPLRWKSSRAASPEPEFRVGTLVGLLVGSAVRGVQRKIQRSTVVRLLGNQGGRVAVEPSLHGGTMQQERGDEYRPSGFRLRLEPEPVVDAELVEPASEQLLVECAKPFDPMVEPNSAPVIQPTCSEPPHGENTNSAPQVQDRCASEFCGEHAATPDEPAPDEPTSGVARRIATWSRAVFARARSLFGS